MHADIWRMVWDHIDDYGPHCFKLQKVAAHRSKASVVDGSSGMCFVDWAGNKAVDLLAKKGAAMHPLGEGIAAKVATAQKKVTMVAKWLGAPGAHLIQA